MKAIKRTKILKYKRRVVLIRLLYNLIAAFLEYPGLPVAGEAIKEIYITNIAVRNRNPEILEAFIRSIYSEFRVKKYNLIHFASFKGDPLLKAAKPFFSTPLYSNIYFSSKNSELLQNSPKKISDPYIDIALI
jgi:hypothetical protein